MAWLLTWLVHGLAIALVTRFALRALPGLSAATRYAMWWAALVLVLILPIVRGLTLRTSAASATAEAGATAGASATGGAGAASEAGGAGEAAMSAATPELTGSTADAAHAAYAAIDAVPLTTRIRSFSLPPISLPRVPDWLLSIVIGLWLGTAMLGLAQIAYSVHAVRRLKESCRRMSVPRESELPMWSAVRDGGRAVRVRSSDCVRTAAVLGLTRPIIAVPRGAAAALTPHEIDQVVLHEYAHVQRYDDWTKLLQVLIAAFAGWHPAVRLMMREIDFEREAACDDYVVDVTGAPRAYARCLTKVIEMMPTPGPDLAALPHAFSSTCHATTRIERLLDRKRPSGRLAVMPAMAGTVTLTVLAFCTVHALPIATDLPRPSSALTPDAMLASAAGASPRRAGTGARDANTPGTKTTAPRSSELRIASASTLPIELPFSRFSPLSRLTDRRLGASRASATPPSVSAAPAQLATSLAASLAPSSPGGASGTTTASNGQTHGDESIGARGTADASVTPNPVGTSPTSTSPTSASPTSTSISAPDGRQSPAANLASAAPAITTPHSTTPTSATATSTTPRRYARDNRAGAGARTRQPASTPDMRAMRDATSPRAASTFALGPVVPAGDSGAMPGASAAGHIGRAWETTFDATSKAVGVSARAVGTATKTAGGATKTATNKAAAKVKASSVFAFSRVKRTIASVF